MSNFPDNSVVLAWEAGRGYRVRVQHDLGYGDTAAINMLVNLTNPTVLEAQALVCEQVAERFTELAKFYRKQLSE